jgi:hypothetical protein
VISLHRHGGGEDINLTDQLHVPRHHSPLEVLNAELITLIRTRIRRHPDLEELLELPTVGDPDAGPTLDPELIRRQVNAAFTRAGYD